VTQRQYHATVSVTNFDMGQAPYYLPIYQRLQATQKLDGSWLYDLVGDQVYSTRSSTKGKTYSFDYLNTTYSAEALNGAGPIVPPNGVLQFAQVPQNQPAEVQKTLDGIIAGKTTAYEKVRAILGYFSAANGFRYTLTTKDGTSGSDLVDFLQHKEGYCQQYAVAMAWLVRAAHIPARVAFGFTQGVRVPGGDTVSLTNLDLHAWTEVYFSNIGWVPFDPTPARSGSVKTTWAPDADHPNSTPGGDTGNGTVDPGVNPSDDPTLNPRGPHEGGPGDNGGLATTPTNPATWRWWVLGGVVVLLAALSVPALRRRSLRRRRLGGRVRAAPPPSPAPVASGAGAIRGPAPDADPPPGQMRVVTGPAVAVRQAHAAWDELIDTLVDYDVPVSDAHTPRVVARRVADELSLTGPPADGLRLLGTAEEQARYARQPDVSGDLAVALRTVRRAIALTRSRRVRMRAAVLPPSVLRRWRNGIGTTGASVINQLGRSRDTAVAAIRPRRLLPRRSGR
jgi:transglutaminase-like putative cysteine protease